MPSTINYIESTLWKYRHLFLMVDSSANFYAQKWAAVHSPNPVLPFEGPNMASTWNSKCSENLQPGVWDHAYSNWLRQAKEVVVVQSVNASSAMPNHISTCLTWYFFNPAGGWMPGRISAVLRPTSLWSGRWGVGHWKILDHPKSAQIPLLNRGFAGVIHIGGWDWLVLDLPRISETMW